MYLCTQVIITSENQTYHIKSVRAFKRNKKRIWMHINQKSLVFFQEMK